MPVGLESETNAVKIRRNLGTTAIAAIAAVIVGVLFGAGPHLITNAGFDPVLAVSGAAGAFMGTFAAAAVITSQGHD